MLLMSTEYLQHIMD